MLNLVIALMRLRHKHHQVRVRKPVLVAMIADGDDLTNSPDNHPKYSFVATKKWLETSSGLSSVHWVDLIRGRSFGSPVN